jgi:hypothetical protein
MTPTHLLKYNAQQIAEWVRLNFKANADISSEYIANKILDCADKNGLVYAFVIQDWIGVNMIEVRSKFKPSNI